MDARARHTKALRNRLREKSSTVVEKGEEEIFPDPMSATMAEGWRGSALKHSSARWRRMWIQRLSNHWRGNRLSLPAEETPTPRPFWSFSSGSAAPPHGVF